MPQTRRNFLGWLAGSLAVYSVGVEPVAHAAEISRDRSGREAAAPDDPPITGAQTYVIRNHGSEPMSVNYQLEGPIEPPLETANGMRIRRWNANHVSTIMLPGEELTISAAPMKF